MGKGRGGVEVGVGRGGDKRLGIGIDVIDGAGWMSRGFSGGRAVGSL